MPGFTATSAWPRPLEFGLRLMVVCAVLFWMTHRYGRAFVDLLLPLFRQTIAALDDHYTILSLATGMEGPDTVVRLRVNLARPIVIAGHLTMPDPRGWLAVTTTIGTVLQPMLVALGLVLAYPAQRFYEWIARLPVVTVLLAAVLLLDTPFTLWAYLWDMHVQAFDPDAFSPLLLWQKFLVAGGRLALGLLVAVLTFWTAARIVRRTAAQ